VRQIILDTETTGLEHSQGHKIIEIGAIEMINRRMTKNTFHKYINPLREIDEAAIEIHGITNERLEDEPVFDDIAVELLGFLKGAELIIHNAPFDVGFLNNEFRVYGLGDEVIQTHCEVLDTLVMARQKHPAEILADVYLQMTGGQTTLLGESEELTRHTTRGAELDIDPRDLKKLKVIQADSVEIEQHDKWLELLRKESEAEIVWDTLNNEPSS
jgi:DNA polymerase-3 subunit epsilon